MDKFCFYLSTIIVFTVSSCTGGLYSHYPKVKKQVVAKETAKEEAERPIVIAEQLKAKEITQQIISLPVPQKVEIDLPPKLIQNRPIKFFTKQNTVENDSIIPLPATDVVNKNAKIAFWSAIGILGSGAAALAFSGFFALLIPVFTLLAFIFSIIALRQIKRTGEYGQPKADFALILSVPILLIALSVLIFLVAQGGLTFTIGITF